MNRTVLLALACAALLIAGCAAPLARLTFPYRAVAASAGPQWFDVTRDGRSDFALSFDDAGRLDALHYDDDQDGRADRAYRIADHDVDRLPHLVILLDSVPFQSIADRYAAGEFRWFGPPAKVIPPFPSLTEVCYTELLGAPPLPGMIDQHYDSKSRRVHSGLWARAIRGHRQPWERRLRYRLKFGDEWLAYLDPQPWYAAELERARRAFDSSGDATTLVYLTSASGLACRFGRDGVEEALDGAARLCLQRLYERRGAVRISLMADHGHNFAPPQNIDVAELLTGGGFRVGKRLDRPDDVVLEVNGLVTYAGVRTTQAASVASRLLTHEGVEFALHLDRDRVVVRTARGSATIESRGNRLRYTPEVDVLDHSGVVESLRAAGKLDADGFAHRDDWLAATADHVYPDAVARLWDAFHGLVVDPPEVMFTTRDGYSAGLRTFERFMTMRSTHGSFNQSNSATFVMTTHGRLQGPLRTREVMKALGAR